jgi:hypothetical protein
MLKYFIFGKRRPAGPSVGNWISHVKYWVEFPNVCVVKYEDLLIDTYTTLEVSFNKLGIKCSERRLVTAIERQSFKIRKNEFEEKGDKTNIKFMRKGIAGDWQRFLNNKMIRRIRREHGPTMNRWGYRN